MAFDPLFQLKSMLPHDGESLFWQQQNHLVQRCDDPDKEKGPPAKAAPIL